MSDCVVSRIAAQDFAVPVTQMRDVQRCRRLTPVPLAPPAIAGLFSLRGRIVTAIDLRVRLDLPALPPARESAMLVVEDGGELYALIVDSVGDVLALEEGEFKPLPATLDARWGAVASKIFLADGGAIVVLDLARLLDLPSPRRAACGAAG